ncbi:MAG: hypothetical protein IJL83_03240 [Clostridia bacterium]|nr:hypothetical protein [Clostridia bacterium]
MSIYNVNKAMGMIDADLIEAAVYPPESEREKAKTAVFAPKPWMKWAAAAAAFVVVVAGALVALNVTGAWRSGGVADPGGSGGKHSGVIASSGSGSVGSEDGSISTDYGTNYPPVPASDSPRTDSEPPDPSEAHGGDNVRWSDYKYLAYDNSLDKLTSFSKNWMDYILEQTGAESLDALWKSVWGGVECGHVAPYSKIEIVEELNIPREKFVELNNMESSRYDHFTEEEIDIIYSGDKKRIAEAFASPWAVVAEDWEIYPIRWLLNNSASTYKEKRIPVDSLETVVNRYINDEGLCCLNDDEISTLLDNVEEYKNMQ